MTKFIAITFLILFIVLAGFALTPWGNGAIDAAIWRVMDDAWLMDRNDGSTNYCRGFNAAADIIGGCDRRMVVLTTHGKTQTWLTKPGDPSLRRLAK